MLRRRLDLVLSVLLVLMMVWVVWEARDWPFRTRLFPWMLGIPVLALTLLQLGAAIRNVAGARRAELAAGAAAASAPARRAAPPPAAPIDDPDAAAVPATVDPRAARARGLAIVGWLLVFFAAIWLLGFRWGTPLTGLVFLRYYAGESWRASVIVVLSMYAFFLLLEAGLSVPLPAGVIPQALGIGQLDVGPLSALRQALLGR